MYISMNLKQIRHSKNITLKQLHIKSGVSISHLNDIENNIKVPTLYILIKIAIALKVDIKELYTIEKY